MDRLPPLGAGLGTAQIGTDETIGVSIDFSSVQDHRGIASSRWLRSNNREWDEAIVLKLFRAKRLKSGAEVMISVSSFPDVYNERSLPSLILALEAFVPERGSRHRRSKLNWMASRMNTECLVPGTLRGRIENLLGKIMPDLRRRA